jgi:hypothetical protein
MLCAAIENAECNMTFLPNASGLSRRRQAVEPFERLWALACVAARKRGVKFAADGLRGVSYAEKMYDYFAQGGGLINPDFKLLKQQSRTGAIGTYWTALIGGRLACPDTGALTQAGRELAKQFPKPELSATDMKRLADLKQSRRISMTFDELNSWSKDCHLVAMNKAERSLLGDALTADDSRNCVEQALQKLNANGVLTERWNLASMGQLRRELQRNEKANSLDLPAVVTAIILTERFHEAVLCVFQLLQWWGTHNSSKPIDSLLSEKFTKRAIVQCHDTAAAVIKFKKTHEEPSLVNAIDGFAGFAQLIELATPETNVIYEILRRHHEVQTGKFDGGIAKSDWINIDNGRVLRPSPLFQRMEQPAAADGNTLTHPYRLEPFIHMLRENRILPQVKREVK